MGKQTMMSVIYWVSLSKLIMKQTLYLCIQANDEDDGEQGAINYNINNNDEDDDDN